MAFRRRITLKNARTERLDLPELDRTRDGTEDRSLADRVTDDDINYERSHAYGAGRQMLDYVLCQRQQSRRAFRERTG